MSITRRSFIKGSAVAAGALGLSLTGLDFKGWAAKAQESEVKVKPSLCNTCSSHCGMWIHVKNDRPWKVTGHEDNMRSQGKLCARAHAGLYWIYDSDRIKQPLKRVGEEEFESISWEQAISEIAEKLNDILEESGPEAAAYGHNPRETGVFYGNRLMHALGISTVCTHNASCNTARTLGFNHTMGGVPHADLSNSNYVVLIGRNLGGGIRTSELIEFTEGVKEGAKVVCVDPRQNDSAKIADEWIPIRPGTDLALVLAMCQVIVEEDLYDKEFIDNYTLDFDKFAETLPQYTPEWAAEITDIEADKIRSLARELAENKPNCLVHPSWKGAFGSNYENSTETARAVAYINALLGNVNQPGGLFFSYNSPEIGSLDTLDPEEPQTPRTDGVGVEGEFPLATSHGLPHVIAEKAAEGIVKSIFIRHHNPVRNFPDYEHMVAGYKNLDLLVVFETHMSETAILADYILPECSFAEREEVVEARGGADRGSVSIRTEAVPKVHPETKSFDEIIVLLAEELGIEEYFDFTLDEVNKARLEPLDISLAELKEKGSISMELPEPSNEVEFSTDSGKFEFYSEDFARYGFSGIAGWKEPAVGYKTANNEFKVIHGKQAYHSQTVSANIPQLAQITKDYDSNRIWMNRAKAEELGINDGDKIKLTSPIATKEVKVKVTERVHPDTLYMPAGYGNKTPYYETAQKIDSLNPNDLTPYQTESIAGHAMMQEVIVKAEKA
ncbi:molybdopterin-dependent oxidoreductase [Fuchsiella alkaliacetigena]|uniref:molybdopterin-dependent oxidoreductase n=1 Tax=Fuchsiella alkaliacetigena TaxID=957042 RepID=UPI00200A9555|nr:molybdopterin-dependent oxidoreductase [Fuchsiella alkaliacetigena]MCK8825007.1 molybdopterin-dependent oxidoreductase [Fuchsiella alkaliacetigena]